MPLYGGKANIGPNIATEEAAGRPHKQAIAIALHVAGKSKLRRVGNHHKDSAGTIPAPKLRPVGR